MNVSVRDTLYKAYRIFDLKTYGKTRYILCLAIRSILNLYVKLAYRFIRIPRINKNENPTIIVSLTSFPARIETLWIILISLLRQTVQPDVIVVYLAKSQFFENKIPKSLAKLKCKGIQIKFVDDDIRSYKKFYYAFQDYPNANVITFDDDIIYPSYTVEKILQAHNEHPYSIVARYVHHITHDNRNMLRPYSEWDGYIAQNPSLDNFFGSGGGTLFPVYKINKDILSADVFTKICPKADDIWLNAFIRLSGFDVYCIDGLSCSIINIQIPNDIRLYKENCDKEQNDVQLVEVKSFIYSVYNQDVF